MLAPRRGSFFEFAGATADAGQRRLLLPEKARVLYRRAIGQGSEGGQPDVNAHGTIYRRQAGRFPLAADRRIPLAGTAMADRDRFGHPFQGAM